MSLLQAVAEVAKLCGEAALPHFRKGIAVDTKSDGTPVTEADRQAEQKARDFISQHFPEDGILGEEFGEVRPGAKRRWIVDPIDGTKAFIRGVPLWGSLVGVAEGTRILAGAAFFPAVGEALVAASGEGCFWNGARCRVSQVKAVKEAAVLSTEERFLVHPERLGRWQSLTRDAAVCRTWGDCYGYLLVATGRAEVMVDEILSPWDAAALLPIIEEAGGVFTDWKGARTAFGAGAIATNGLLDAEVRGKLLDERPPHV
jgi:histidinol phosphatase-like enzyme (inositol monophosphatase family)